MKTIRKTFILVMILVTIFNISCDTDSLFNKKDLDRLSIQASRVSIDIDEASNEYLIFEASGKNKKGNELNPNVRWEFDPAVFRQVGSASQVLRLELNVDGIGVAGRDITGRTVVSCSAEGKKAEAVVNVTGKLKSIWFEDENGNMITSIIRPQKSESSLKIATYPRSAGQFELIGQDDPSHLDVASIIVNSSSRIANIKTDLPGTATLRVQTSDGSKSAALLVLVSEKELPETAPSRIAIRQGAYVSVPSGQQLQLEAVVYDQYSREVLNPMVNWSIDNPDIASLSPLGVSALIQPRTTGELRVTATLEETGLSATTIVSIGSPLEDILISRYEPPAVALYRVAKSVVNEESAQSKTLLPIGKTVYFKASYYPEDTTEKGVIWSVDSDAVSFSQDNEIVSVRAEREGSTNIIATSTKNPDVASYVSLAVYDPEKDPDLFISSLSINPSSAEIEVGKEIEIAGSVIFQDGSKGISDLLWTTDSSAIEILSISADTSKIVVKGKQEGVAMISVASLANPYVTSSVAILCYNEGGMDKTKLLKLSSSPTSLTLLPKSKATISLSYLPSSASKGISSPVVSSDCVLVQKFTDSEVELYAVKEGTANISVYSLDNPSIYTTFSVRVLSEEQASVPSKISLSRNILELAPNNYSSVEATVLLLNGSILGNPKLLIENQAEDIFSAELDGTTITVRAIAPGIGTATISLEDNAEVKTTLYVTVGDQGLQLKALALSQQEITLIEGDEAEVSVSYLPSLTSETGVNWSIVDGSVAYLTASDENLLIEANKKGSTIINVQSIVRPGISSKLRVNVISKEEALLPSYIKIKPSSVINIDKGEYAYIDAEVYNAAGVMIPDVAVDWSLLEGEDIISIYPQNYDLRILGNVVGIAKVKAQVRNTEIIEEVEVRVVDDLSDPSVEVQTFVPSSRTLTLVEGAEKVVDISYIPSDTFQKGVVYSISNDSIVSVSLVNEGIKVKALSKGSSEILLRSSYKPALQSSISVRVITQEEAKELVARVSVSPETLEINPPFPTSELEITATSYNSSDTAVSDSYTFRVDQERDVISIRYGMNNNAYIRIIGAGNAKIIVRSNLNPSVEATVNVFVGGKLDRLTLLPESLKLYRNGKATLRVGFIPTNSVDKNIKWDVISEDGINRVMLIPTLGDSTTATVTALASGKSKVRVSSQNNPDIFTELEIEVLSDILPDSSVPYQIKLSSSVITIDPPYNVTPLTATVLASDGSVYPLGVRWEIENGKTVVFDKKIATLSPSGDFSVRITPEAAGEATITAISTVDETVRASASLIIRGSIAEIRWQNLPNTTGAEFLSIVQGESQSVEVKLLSANGGETVEKDLEWYEEGFIPVYDDDGRLIGYDTNDDGLVDDTGAGMSFTLRPTSSGCTINAKSVAQTTLVCRSKIRPNVSARLAIDIVPRPSVTGVISLSPSELNLSPTSDKVMVTATIITDNGAILNPDVEINLEASDPNLLSYSSPLWSQSGTVYTVYAAPGNKPGAGYLTASLPEYPGIKTATIRVFLGGSLVSFKPYNPNGDDDVLIVSKGDVVSIGVDYVPAITTQTGVSWSSSDSAILDGNFSTTSNRITLTAKKPGAAVITAVSKENPSITYSFTITVKPIIESVEFVGINDTHTSTGLTFTTTTDKPLTLRCSISPEILNDTKKLELTPHGILPGTVTDLATLKQINGTVNDYIFTPAKSMMGTYQYDIVEQNSSLAGKVLGTLTINVTTEDVHLTILEGVVPRKNTSVFVFDKGTDEFTAYIEGRDDTPLAGFEWTTSNYNAVKIIDNKDNTVTVRVKGTRNDGVKPSAGYAEIRAHMPNASRDSDYVIKTYVNYDIPDSLEAALIETNTISELNGGRYYDAATDTWYSILTPEVFNSIETLNLSNCRIDGGVEVNGYLKLFTNMKELNLSNCILDSRDLDLTKCNKLEILKVIQPENADFRLDGLRSSLPANVKRVELQNNFFDNVTRFRSTNLEYLDLRNNQLTSFSDSGFPSTLQYVDVSNNNKMQRITLENPSIKTFKGTNSIVERISVSCSNIEEIDVSNNVITRAELTVVPKLKQLRIQNNKLESGILKINDWSYNNHNWSSTKNWGSVEITAYGNKLSWMFTDQGADNSTRTFSAKYSNTIPTGTIVLDVREKAWHHGWGDSNSGYGFGISSVNQYISESGKLSGDNKEWNSTVTLVRSQLTSLEQTFLYRLDAGVNNGTSVTDWRGYDTNDFSHNWSAYQSRTAIKALVYPFGI